MNIQKLLVEVKADRQPLEMSFVQVSQNFSLTP